MKAQMKKKEQPVERKLLKGKMEFHPEQCTGCIQCLLACSLYYEGVCNPLMARSSVIRKNDRTEKITLKSDCTFCGICTNVCLYGARTLRRSK